MGKYKKNAKKMQRGEVCFVFPSNGAIVFPKKGDKFDNYLIAKRCLIVSCSNAKLVGSRCTYKGAAPTNKAYFQYHCKNVEITREGGDLIIHGPRHYNGRCTVTPIGDDDWTAVLRQELCTEIEKVIRSNMPDSKRLKENLEWVRAWPNDPPSCPHWSDKFYELCDLKRVPLRCDILVYYASQRDKDVPNLVRKLEKLRVDQLTQICKTLKHNAACMAFPHNFKIGELTFGAFNAIKPRPPVPKPEALAPVIIEAMRLYDKKKQLRAQQGHTLVEPYPIPTKATQYMLTRCCGKPLQNLNMYVFVTDKRDVQRITTLLQHLFEGAKRGLQPEQRDFYASPVPCIPAAQFEGQQALAAKCILQEPFVCINGGPGTGKTSVLEFVLATYKNVANCAFVGKMIDTLKGRLNNHNGVAHTIHSIIAMVKYNKAGPRWIGEIEVLCIDEGSNISTHLMGRLFDILYRHAHKLKKLIIFGDVGQIPPIEAGNPFKDFITHMSARTITLHENKRVEPLSRALADASALFHRGVPELAQYTDEGPLTLLNHVDLTSINNGERYGRVRSFLLDILDVIGTDDLTGSAVLNVQCISMLNDDRRAVNTIMEQLLIDRGVLRRPNECIEIGKRGKAPPLKLYVGLKIAFRKNVKPVLDDSGNIIAHGVQNGEIGIITECSRERNFDISLTIVNTLGGNKKSITLNNRDGVPPHTVDLGYASTCNAAQGSEYKYVIVVPPRSVGSHSLWTREFPYVAVSRAKRRCWFICSMQTLSQLCARAALPRRTFLGYLLDTQRDVFPNEPINLDDVEVPDFSKWTLMPPAQEHGVVPRIETYMIKEAPAQKKRKKRCASRC